MKCKSALFLVLAVSFCMLLAANRSYSASDDLPGDVNGDGNIGLQEAIYALQVVAGLQPTPCIYYASGTYDYNSSTSRLETDFTDSNFPPNEGPPLGGYQHEVLSIDATTMLLLDIQENEQITFTRDSGTAGDITGIWQVEENVRVDINESGSISVCAYYVPKKTFTVPVKTIKIDGDFGDWTQAERVYEDTDGPDCGNIAGQDIQEVYVAQDDNYIYVRMILNDLPDQTFGYKFGETVHLHASKSATGPHLSLGAPMPWCGLTLPSQDVVFVTNQFECRFDKCQVSHWDVEDLAAWCDQGKVTSCRDYIDLPIMTLDFSMCDD